MNPWVIVGSTVLLVIGSLGVAAWLSRPFRAAMVKRYPLVLVTSIIVVPHGVALAAALVVGMVFRDAPAVRNGIGFLPVGLAGTAACVLVLWQTVRARLGDCRSGPYLPAILGFGIGGFISVANLDNMAHGPDIAVYGAALALGAGFNGVMAVWINAARRDAVPLDVAAPRPVGEPIPPGPLPPRPLD